MGFWLLYFILQININNTNTKKQMSYKLKSKLISFIFAKRRAINQIFCETVSTYITFIFYFTFWKVYVCVCVWNVVPVCLHVCFILCTWAYLCLCAGMHITWFTYEIKGQSKLLVFTLTKEEAFLVRWCICHAFWLASVSYVLASYLCTVHIWPHSPLTCSDLWNSSFHSCKYLPAQ